MTEHADPQAPAPAASADGREAPASAGSASSSTATATEEQVPAPTHESGEVDVETLVTTLEAVTAERDSHLVDLQRLTAEFANFRRQATKRQTDTVAHAASHLVEKLLPVLDACDAAVQHGAADVEPIHGALLEILRKDGLEVVAEAGEPFDPERHEAVAHEPGDGGEPTVAEILRTGYVWNSRVLRPAMVRVHG